MEPNKKILVIGYGSIGSRHCRILQEMGQNLAVVSSRTDVPFETFHDVQIALDTFAPEFVLVTNRTCSHQASLENLSKCNFRGTSLVEKPLFGKLPSSDFFPDFSVYVAYNLRFNPIIRRVKEIISKKIIYSAQFYVGQYLPNWRPGTDYRHCYSAHKSQGGGALKDLSHELDLALWLMGTWRRVAALGGKVSDLEISSDDVFCLLLETAQCPVVSIQVNYLDLQPRREMILNVEGVSVRADLVSGKLAVNDNIETYEIGRNQTYSAQLEALLRRDMQTMCSYAEGLDVIKLICAAEEAARKGKWVQKN
jgi:hypothetical protein